ncbi:MAG: monovalent cation/H+ antiporter subunit D family protein [Alphaproteobacteria bacterium]|nr:monovalent cation/H+ antiporter subunit D family protein [Alphaproteobacteria bacterium]
MAPHFPILQIIVPLLAAPLAAMSLLFGQVRMRHLAWGVTTLSLAIAFFISLALFVQVQSGGTISYALGDWQAPIGIVYIVDSASSFILPLICGIALVATLFAPRLLKDEISLHDQPIFYTLWLLTIAGMLGQVITGDAFNIFVFLEITSLSAYALIALGVGRDRRALPAAFNYLILGTLGATFYVIGIGLLYMLTGTLNLDDLATRLPALADNNAAAAALAFISIGLFLKMALFPLHFWLVPAYGYAPSIVSVLLAATATKVSVYVLIRFLFGVFGVEFDGIATLGSVIILLGVLGALVGTLAAIFERDIKRLLAQSSIAQLGYMAIGIGLMSHAGLTAAFIHLFNHALMKGALFIGLGALGLGLLGTKKARLTLDNIRGAGRAAPITMAGILIGGLALIGVPLTAGFISKLYLIRATIDADLWATTALIALSSVLALVYVWKIVEAAWLQPPTTEIVIGQEKIYHWLPVWIFVAATIGFGIYATPLIEAAQAAASLFVENK